MHLYAFHNKEIRKNTEGQSMSYQPNSARYWNDYFGYTTASKSGSNEAINYLCKHPFYKTFQEEHALFLENIKREDQKALPALELSPSQCQAKAVAGAASENNSIEPKNSPAIIESVKAVAASENDSIELEKPQDESSPVESEDEYLTPDICQQLRHFTASESPADWSEYMEFREKFDTSYIPAEQRKAKGIETLLNFPDSYDDLLKAMKGNYCIISTKNILLNCLKEMNADIGFHPYCHLFKDNSGEWSTDKVVEGFDSIFGGEFGNRMEWEEIFEKLFHEKVSSSRFQISLEKMIHFPGTSHEEKAYVHLLWRYLTAINHKFALIYPCEFGVPPYLRKSMITLLKSLRKGKRPCLEQSSHADIKSLKPTQLATISLSAQPGCIGMWYNSPATIEFVNSYSDLHYSGFEEEFLRRTDLHKLVGRPDDLLEVKQDIAWDCVVSNAMDKKDPPLPTWENQLAQLCPLEMIVWPGNQYHYGGPYPNNRAETDEDSAVSGSKDSMTEHQAKRRMKKAESSDCIKSAKEKKESNVHLRVHFYNCPEFGRIGQVDSSVPQCEHSMIESHTHDYRVDREMAPVFRKLGKDNCKMPSFLKVFDRVEEVAADAARKKKANVRRLALESAEAAKQERKMKRQHGSGAAGDGGSG